jgi:hypothetical protein
MARLWQKIITDMNKKFIVMKWKLRQRVIFVSSKDISQWNYRRHKVTREERQDTRARERDKKQGTRYTGWEKGNVTKRTKDKGQEKGARDKGRHTGTRNKGQGRRDKGQGKRDQRHGMRGTGDKGWETVGWE